MERPALQQLLADIRERQVDIVVVYKVDRLTRSLADFAKMVEVFDSHAVSFVAVTQQFNTTTSMGRLTLNVLLSFAQFEREVTGERIRDEIAASKRKGMWMGGVPPLGYDVSDRRLVINEAEAHTVQRIYRLYLELGSVRQLKDELAQQGIVSKVRISHSGRCSGGCRLGRGALYQLLANPIYLGEIRHKGNRYPGQHTAIVERALWEQVQEHFKVKTVRRHPSITKTAPSLLAGRLFDEHGEPLYVAGAAKGLRRYRYYVSRGLVRGRKNPADRGWRLPAPELERAVTAAVVGLLADPSRLAQAIAEYGFSASEFEYLLNAAQQRINISENRAWEESLLELLDRVQLRSEQIELTLTLNSLLPAEGSAARPATLTLAFPIKLKRRGVETRLVLPGGFATIPRTDPALLKLVARGYRWFHELSSRQTRSTQQIAEREGLTQRYVRQVLPLGLLAPPIVEAICRGQQAPSLTAEKLKDRTRLKLAWDAQQRQLSC
jgi:hypothetical protein